LIEIVRRLARDGRPSTPCSGQSLAQTAREVSDTELSKEIENPVTRRIALPLRCEADFLDGPYKAT
jgi:hypothetical protein